MKLSIFSMVLALPYLVNGQEIPAQSPKLNSNGSNGIIITEIMADPDPSNGLPIAEFVEILNNSPDTVNLTGWNFFDGSLKTLSGVEINPDEYLIICANSDTSDFSTFGKYAGVSSISLTNGGEKISLRNPQGIPVDSVVYSDNWYGSSFKKDGGWSLERIDISYPCLTTINWKPSENVHGGTPGQENSIAGQIIDNIPPLLLRAFCSDSLSAFLVFNEPIDPTTISDLSGFSINPSIEPTEALIAGEENDRILLHFSVPFDSSVIYSVSVNGIADCSGNTINPVNTAKFALADSITKNDITINEVLFDPFEGGYDFVELFHTGNHVIDLKDVKIASIDPNTSEIKEVVSVSSESWPLFPGDYIVITENPATVSGQYRSSFPFQFVPINELPAMNIDEGYIAVISGEQRIDEFKYSDKYHFKLLNETKGISLEKINPYFNSMDPSAWHSSSATSGYATPGLKNSQFTEVLPGTKNVSANPEIFSPDNDGHDDIVSFSINPGIPGYISNLWIYNAMGQVIYSHNKNNMISTSEIFNWDGLDENNSLAPAGIYVALIELFNLDGNIEKQLIPLVLARKL